MCTLPDIGQVVLYSLTEEQAEEITRRRQQQASLSGYGPGVIPGDAVPMLVAACASGYGDGFSRSPDGSCSTTT